MYLRYGGRVVGVAEITPTLLTEFECSLCDFCVNHIEPCKRAIDETKLIDRN